MKQRARIYYSEKQKSLMWDRWQKGDSLHAIARLFDRHHPSIAGIFSRTGWHTPTKKSPIKFSFNAFRARGHFQRYCYLLINPSDCIKAKTISFDSQS